MVRLRILFIIILTALCIIVSAQVRVRLFSNQTPESAIFSVTEGTYEITADNREILTVLKDESVLIAGFNGKLTVKTRNAKGFVCDSLTLSAKTGNDSFSLRIIGILILKQYYTGDLKCYPDLGTLVFVNITDIERYIPGVVMAEGGNGKNLEYFKAQAIIARTYMYKYFDKHITDNYNVCDNTHCQAFNGVSSDTLCDRATRETRGLVILDKDNILIISAFHSNCGGETSSSYDVWLISQPYLKRVTDPYCLFSRNAIWQKSISVSEWISYLRKSGYNDKVDDPSGFNFVQETRLADYKTGFFIIPLRTIRSDLNLRSTFFSVYSKGDSLLLKGRGYGHGVGLCQEGAMVMAGQGLNYREIIDFYYSGVNISDIKNAVALH